MERYCSTGQSPQRAVAPTEGEDLVLTGLNQMILITSTYFHCFQMFILYGIIFI